MKPTPNRTVLCPACGCAEIYRQRFNDWERILSIYCTASPYICDGCWCRIWWRSPVESGPTP
jgi:hypothetical protein